MKKIINIVIWSLLFLTLIFSMGFAFRKHDGRTCEKMEVLIDRINSDRFLEEDAVHELLRDKGIHPEGKPLSEVNVAALEKIVLAHPAVETGEVYADVNGVVTVHLLQRRPISRVISVSGESYYFDHRGYLMPWSETYTASVLFANGEIADSYAAMYTVSFDSYGIDSALKTKTMLDDIWQISKRIQADTFFTAQIVQLNYTAEKGFIMTPRIGSHAIVLGTISELDEKLNKLKLFYREGIGRTGRWNSYTIIDLQYKNQVVCTKKTE
jgi:cell division protein FtsQ